MRILQYPPVSPDAAEDDRETDVKDEDDGEQEEKGDRHANRDQEICTRNIEFWWSEMFLAPSGLTISSVRPVRVCLELSIFIILAQVTLKPLLGPSYVSLSLKYFVLILMLFMED